MSEIDKTIEELEAEVLAELEEASEKPLGKAKDLGLGSNNADEGVSKAKDPAPNVAGADKKEAVKGEKAKDLGGLDGQDEKVDKAKDKKADAVDQSEHEIVPKRLSERKQLLQLRKLKVMPNRRVLLKQMLLRNLLPVMKSNMTAKSWRRIKR